MSKFSSFMLILLTIFAVSTSAIAATISCKPVNAGALAPWAENACALDHSTSPESWVKGWATFDATSAQFNVRLKVETDSTTGGPCGTITASLLDAQGNVLAVAKSKNEICLAGKPPGHAVSYTWSKTETVPTALANRVAIINVSITRTRNVGGI